MAFIVVHMDRLMDMPISEDWTASTVRDPTPATVPERAHDAVATARDLVEVLAQYEVAALEPWRDALAAAGAELAELASSMSMPPAAIARLERVQWGWRYPSIAPTVVVVRQLVWLASIAPGAWSTRAATLIAALRDAE